ncbi:MAG: tetratricopeptide repeat protein, partial [Acidiferrobacterales bacterium]
MEDRLPRKLAVILHADVVGSTALVQRNESLAHARIQDAFRRFSLTIEAYSGVTHELRGDALVAEFARASDAVAAGLAFQIENTESNARLEDDLQPRLRIGISLGEVVIADNTVTGAGVVLAQRVEQLAEPGGVCITGAIHEAVPQYLPLDYSDLGKREVKGFEEPVQVYRASLKAGEQVPPPEPADSVEAQSRTPKRLWTAGAIAVLLVVGALAWWQPWVQRVEPASVERMAFPLPDKPSIAVLPFDNLSGDPEQDYFSDGLTEDIITHLTRFPDLFVIARNSTFTYKGKAVKVKQVAEELGVHYVLEGSVQKAGEKVRITAQLIDATTGHHLWAENFDRTLDDVFAVRDEVMQSIVSTLMGSDYAKLRQAELVRLSRKDPANLGAYELVQRAIKIWLRFTKEANEEARGLIEKAIELDPGYARAYTMLAWVNLNEYQYKFSDDPEKSLERAFELAQKSIALDDADDWSHWALGVVYLYQRKFDESIAEYERALARNPNDADVLAHMGLALTFAGQPERAIQQLTRAKRLNPNYPPWYPSILGFAYVVAKQYEPAIIALREQVNRMPDWPTPHRTLAVAYAQLGRQDDARGEVETLLKLDPQASIENVKLGLPFKDEGILEHFLGGLRKAGLPEAPPLALPDKPSIAVLPFTNMSDDPK